MFYIFTCIVLLIPVIVLGGLRIYVDFRNGHGLTTLFALYFGFVLVDVFIPALAMLVTGEMPPKPPWVPVFSREEVAWGGIVGILGFLMVLFGYTVGYGLSGRWADRVDATTRIVYTRAMIMLCIMVAVYIITQLNIINRLGGPLEYFLSMVKFRRSVFEANESLSEHANSLVTAIARDTSLGLCAVIFAERRSLGLKKRAWLIVGVGLLISMSTFYRGTIMLYGLMLLAAQQLAVVKFTSAMPREEFERYRRVRRKQRRNFIRALVVIITLFSGYGTARSFFGAKEWEVYNYSVWDGFSKEFNRFTEGAGFYSLVDIVHSFPMEAPFLDGSTIANQAVRYIPRSIIPDKPKNYGAVEITNAMEYPLTGEGVTIPGEAWANFGFAGLPLVSLFGLLFGYLTANRYRGRMQYFFLSMGVSIILAVGWFSFTGFMSWLPSAIIMWICVGLITTRRPIAARGADEDGFAVSTGGSPFFPAGHAASYAAVHSSRVIDPAKS